MSQALTPLRLNIRARQGDFPWSYRQSRQRRPAPNRRIRQGVAPFPSVASLEACEPRTSNGRVLVRRTGQRSNPVENGPVLRRQQLPRPDRSVTSMPLSGGRVR